MKHNTNKLKFKSLGIHTQHEHFVYMRKDCHLCYSEGFEALTRICISYKKKTIVASLNVLSSNILTPGEISLSESAIKALGVQENDILEISHLAPIESISYIRSKIYGNELNENQLESIINDIVLGNLSNIHLSAFITACAGDRLNIKEVTALTRAMIKTGEQINWQNEIVADKHCIGGLPGNRTTPIIVAIISAFNILIPKTSSRAITSPAGTADTMEVITDVNLTLDEIKSVVSQEYGCIVSGNTAKLSPADDILIRVEKALDIDSEGQLVASVLSKKIAAGSNHVIIDIPVGKTAKIRNEKAAHKLKKLLEDVAKTIGLKLKVIITDGSQPIGRGIGPALEARDILAILRNRTDESLIGLKEKSLRLSGALLELTGKVNSNNGYNSAKKVLESGKAFEKFRAICNAQGGFKEPKLAKFKHEIIAKNNGTITQINNRKLALLAKLAGAPDNKSSGIDFLSPLGKQVKKGDILYIIYAEAKGELMYALDYYDKQNGIITIE